jgi:hypothetical protein
VWLFVVILVSGLRGRMRCLVGTLAAALGCVAAVGAFHTPYRPEQSRHYDVTKTETFKPITEKVRLIALFTPSWSGGAAADGRGAVRGAGGRMSQHRVVGCTGVGVRCWPVVVTDFGSWCRCSTCTMPTAHTCAASMA